MKELKGYKKGINLGGWLSQCDHTKERYENFIKESDIEVIKSWGLDHIRVPVDYNLVEDEAGNYVEEGFAYIERAHDWASKYGLNMILDLHKTCGYSFDPDEHEKGFFDDKDLQERFIRLWEEFARRFGGYRDDLCFELLNEVTDKSYCDSWNAILTECIRRIRAIEPEIKIITGGYYHNSIEALKDLAAPYDENVVYTFHFYEPHIFTHQGAAWMAPPMDTAFTMPFDSTYEEYTAYAKDNLDSTVFSLDKYDQNSPMGVEFFEDCFQEAVRVAKERDVALYCGEYGVIENADPKEAIKWFKIVGDCFRRYDIGRAAWSYKEMNFGIADKRMDEVRDELLKIM